MTYPSVTNSFTSGTTGTAASVNQNFTDLVSALTDGTKDILVNDAGASVGVIASFVTCTNGCVSVNTATVSGNIECQSSVVISGTMTVAGTCAVASSMVVYGNVTATAETFGMLSQIASTNQTVNLQNQSVWVPGQTNERSYRMATSGSLRGYSIYTVVNAFYSPATFTPCIVKNGTTMVVGTNIAWTGAGQSSSAYGTFAKGSHVFATSDRIGIKLIVAASGYVNVQEASHLLIQYDS